MRAPNIENIKKLVAADYPLTDELLCVDIKIPASDNALSVLAGMYAILTQSWAWSGTKEDRIARAAMWQVAYAANSWDGCMDCDGVAECIETSEAVQAALAANLITNLTTNDAVLQALYQAMQDQNSPGQPMTDARAGAGMPPDGTFDTDGECDLNKLWTGCKYLSEYIDGLCTDFFERMAELDEEAKIVAQASGAIPVVGSYAQTAIQFALALKEKIAATYVGESTLELRENIACSWFCLAQVECNLSIEQAIAVMSDRLGTITPEDFAAFMELAITGSFSGPQIVEVGYLLALEAIRFGQKFGNALGVKPLGDIMAIGASDPDNSWNFICETCPGACIVEYDFTIDEQGWISSTRDSGFWGATYVAGVGWKRIQGEGSDPGITLEILKAWDSADTIAAIEVTYTLTDAGDTGNVMAPVDSSLDGTTIAGFGTVVPLEPGAHTATYTGMSKTIDNGYVGINSDEYYVPTGAYLIITNIKIRYQC